MYFFRYKKAKKIGDTARVSGGIMRLLDLNQEVLLKVKHILDNALPQQEQHYYQNIEDLLVNPLFSARPATDTIQAKEIDVLYNKFSKELDKLIKKGLYPSSLQEKTLEAFRSSASVEKDSPSSIAFYYASTQPISSHPSTPTTVESIEDNNHLEEIEETVDSLEKQGLYDEVPFDCLDDLKQIVIFHIESGGECRSLSQDIFELLHKKGKIPETKANELARQKDNLIWTEVPVVCPKKRL